MLAERSVLRRPRNLAIALVVLALLAGGLWWGLVRPGSCGSGPASAPARANPTGPNPSSGEPVDLEGWKLTLPEAGEKGHAASVSPASSSAPWLTREDSGGLTFWAPVCGATTPNSEHPRTELVSLNNFKAGTSGQHTLTASVAVSQAPAGNQDVIIGQIHGADDISSVPFVMLHYTAGQVRVVVKEKQSGSTSDKYTLLTNVPLRAWFDYAISDNGDGTVTFSATSGTTGRFTIPIPEPFRGATVRFQAGSYQQGDPSEDTAPAPNGALVTFARLRENIDSP